VGSTNADGVEPAVAVRAIPALVDVAAPEKEMFAGPLRQDGPHAGSPARETANVSEASPISEPLDLAHELQVADPPTTNVGWSDDSIQIRSRIRVRDLAEVYTHDREVNAMLDLVPDMFPTEDDPGNTDRTFLEPACGHGNFLVEILRRKLTYVTTSRYGRGENFEYWVLRCLTSIYGIDISEDNVVESCKRMRSALEAHLDGIEVTRGFTEAVGVILSTNIQRADTLTDARRVELVEYRPVGNGTFVREWSYLEEQELDLFSDPEPRRDAEAVHYSELIDHPEALTRTSGS
jgi:hypothetical protein